MKTYVKLAFFKLMYQQSQMLYQHLCKIDVPTITVVLIFIFNERQIHKCHDRQGSNTTQKRISVSRKKILKKTLLHGYNFCMGDKKGFF